MMDDVGVKQDDLAREYRRTAMFEVGCGRLGEESYGLPTGRYGNGADLGQSDIEPLHPNGLEANLCDAGVETSFCGRKNLDLRSLNRALAKERVGELKQSIPRHRHSQKILRNGIMASP